MRGGIRPFRSRGKKSNKNLDAVSSKVRQGSWDRQQQKQQHEGDNLHPRPTYLLPRPTPFPPPPLLRPRPFTVTPRIPRHARNEWEKRLSEWKKNQRMKQEKAGAGDGAKKLTYPDELRCPAWCRTFKRRDGTVPFDVSAMVPSPEQEVCTRSRGKPNTQRVPHRFWADSVWGLVQVDRPLGVGGDPLRGVDPKLCTYCKGSRLPR